MGEFLNWLYTKWGSVQIVVFIWSYSALVYDADLIGTILISVVVTRIEGSKWLIRFIYSSGMRNKKGKI